MHCKFLSRNIFMFSSYAHKSSKLLQKESRVHVGTLTPKELAYLATTYFIPKIWLLADKENKIHALYWFLFQTIQKLISPIAIRVYNLVKIIISKIKFYSPTKVVFFLFLSEIEFFFSCFLIFFSSFAKEKDF